MQSHLKHAGDGCRTPSWPCQASVAVMAWLLAFVVWHGTAARIDAQEPGSSSGGSSSELALRQGRIADKYARLEQLMLKMAEVDAATNPKRAALLKQAVQQSKEKLTRTQLETVVKLLDQQQLKRAVDGQSAATSEMKLLLELLLSENRADRNKGEQDRIKQYIQDVERLLRLQKDVQGRTAGDEQPERLASDQRKIAERTGDLAKEIQKNEEPNQSSDTEAKPAEGEQKPGEQKPGEQKPGEKKPSEPKPGDEQPGEQKPSQSKPGDMPDKEPKPGEQAKPGTEPKPGEQPMPGEQSKPGDQPMPGGEPKPGGQPMPGGEPMPGQAQPPQDQQQQQQQNPARQRLQQAEQKMREAQKKLEEAKRDDAQEAQEQARQELEKAKAELEEILRQLREEEIERTLAQLEARFRKMLEMQLKVQAATQRLASIPPDARTREVDIEAGKLSIEERKIALEADKAYQLLLEEGSSIAFPESVEEIRSDMEQVAERLSRTQLDEVTLGAEEDIISALNELIAALQQAQQDQEKKRQNPMQPMPPGEGRSEDQPLVDRIAELKMLKAMQLRVNERTKRFAGLLAEPDDITGQATDADLQSAIEKLSERQSRLHRITRDIVLGKNQ